MRFLTSGWRHKSGIWQVVCLSLLLVLLLSDGRPAYPAVSASAQKNGDTRDVCWFLQRLRSVEHLPELEDSKTAMSSTWDRTGGNRDGNDFKCIKDGRNILLDVNGPGCIHRIFVGMVDIEFKDTYIQIFIDHKAQPVIDMSILQFFDDRNGPFSYPLVFHKSYPGLLFPIPFAEHILIQLVNKAFATPEWDEKQWSNYWQITYTKYLPETKVKSFTLPFSDREKEEIEMTCEAWLEAESQPPPEPAAWTLDHTWTLEAGECGRIVRNGCGVMRQMRMTIDPSTSDILRNLRMRIYWDGAENPSVDVPAGYFFGNAHADYPQRVRTSVAAVTTKRPQPGWQTYGTDFNSLLVGAKMPEAVCRFPMPFARGAVLEFENNTSETLANLHVKISIEEQNVLPLNFGRFHTTWTEERAAENSTPKLGPGNVPVKVGLERRCRGKYIGTMLHVVWPYDKLWWGEGDWLIWTDEHGWPPSYHGTGSEEYFNSGWCRFDRKAVSGFVSLRPGDVTVYSFHLNDAFQFSHFIRVCEEQMSFGIADKIIRETHPVWGATAFWYALPTQPAGSHVQADPIVR